MREVPDYQVREYLPKRARYCMCIFVINENGKLHTQLDKTRPWSDAIDVVIADGGSTDGSTDDEALRSRGVNALLTKTGPGKLGAQMRMAFAWALDRGYAGIVCIDGNNKDGPDAVPAFIARLDAGYDHVQGSRFIPGGVSENLPPSRWAGVRLVHAPLISLAARFRYTDTTNGFRAYSRRLLEDSRIDLFRDIFAGYELHYYLAIRSARLGFKVCELPVARRYPSDGPVPTKITPFRGNIKVLGSLIAACIGRYNPPAVEAKRQ